MEVRSVAEMRALLGDEAAGMSDAEVLALRDEIYGFAQVLFRGYVATCRPVTDRGPVPRRPRLKRSA